MKNIFAVGLYILAGLSAFTSFGQKKVTILGSSTAAGTGASPDSGWVSRLATSFKKNLTDGIDTVVNNRAVGGYVTYKSLPTGHPIPADRPAPDPNANVSYVLAEMPRADIVIINYPTNDIAFNYNPKEMMDNLRVMFEQLNANGIRTFISTTQPRNFDSESQRLILKQLVDSIQINFGNYAINFWDDLVSNDGLNRIRAEVSAGDGVHINNLGHRLLFERVQAKNIFGLINNAPLPVILKNWQASMENNVVKLKWNTAHEEASTLFEIQRSANGISFNTLSQLRGVGHDAEYSWADASPLNGKSFYRLKITEMSKVSYSRVLPIINDKSRLVTSFYADGSQIRLQLNSNINYSVELSIINFSGATIKRQTVNANSNQNITVPISELASGNYFLRITTPNGTTIVERFTKMK